MSYAIFCLFRLLLSLDVSQKRGAAPRRSVPSKIEFPQRLSYLHTHAVSLLISFSRSLLQIQTLLNEVNSPARPPTPKSPQLQNLHNTQLTRPPPKSSHSVAQRRPNVNVGERTVPSGSSTNMHRSSSWNGRASPPVLWNGRNWCEGGLGSGVVERRSL